MTTYEVREVILSTEPFNATTLPSIIQFNDPQDGSTLAGFFLQDPKTLVLVWANNSPVTTVSTTS